MFHWKEVHRQTILFYGINQTSFVLRKSVLTKFHSEVYGYMFWVYNFFFNVWDVINWMGESQVWESVDILRGKKSQIFVHTCMLNVKQYIDVRLDYSWMESELC